MGKTCANCMAWLFLVEPVDGGWSDWTFGECSKTCGNGKKQETRTCTNPPPSNGGKDCKGKSSGKRKKCNLGSCDIRKLK